jgi:hypothetical protein
LVIERPQLGHFGQHGGGDHRAYSLDRVEPFGFMGQLSVGGDELSQGSIALVDLFL